MKYLVRKYQVASEPLNSQKQDTATSFWADFPPTENAPAPTNPMENVRQCSIITVFSSARQCYSLSAGDPGKKLVDLSRTTHSDIQILVTCLFFFDSISDRNSISVLAGVSDTHFLLQRVLIILASLRKLKLS